MSHWYNLPHSRRKPVTHAPRSPPTMLPCSTHLMLLCWLPGKLARTVISPCSDTLCGCFPSLACGATLSVLPVSSHSTLWDPVSPNTSQPVRMRRKMRQWTWSSHPVSLLLLSAACCLLPLCSVAQVVKVAVGVAVVGLTAYAM